MIKRSKVFQTSYTTASRTSDFWTSGSFHVRRVGDVVSIQASAVTIGNITTRTYLMTLPEEYRPWIEFYSARNKFAVSSNGRIWSDPDMGGNQNIYDSMTYLVNP